MADYKEAPLATRPKTLDPNEYFNVSPERRRLDQARAALQADLKRQYLLQLNNPHRHELIEDQALKRWEYARTKVYPNFRVTKKTSLFGLLFAVVPVGTIYYVLKTDRDRKSEQIKNGIRDRKFNLTS